MSLVDLDKAPRMTDTLTPEDLNVEACVNLAATILEESGIELTRAVRRYAEWLSKESKDHLDTCKAFYRSDLFTALCGGVVDGETAMNRIAREALRGRKMAT